MDIRSVLSNRAAVEKAMLVLSLTGDDERSREYYVSWIKRGNQLSGHHLDRARALALKHEAALTVLANRKGNSRKTPSGKGKFLTMNRQGTFKIATFGDSHCGTTNPLDVKYQAVIKCSPETDHRGFLFDQLMVQGFFDSIRKTSLSCEKLAMFCTDGLLERIHQENPEVTVYHIEMTLSPAPYLASMTYHWVGDEQV